MPADETVLVICARHSNSARAIAGDLNGAYTVMEEIAGKFMADRLNALIAAEPARYAHWLFKFSKACHRGHGILDPTPLGKRYADGRVGGDLLATGNGRREGARPAIEALDRIVRNPTLANLAAAMDVIPTAPALRLHSHEAWYGVRAAIRGAIANGDSTDVLLHELTKAREMIRHAGRRECKGTISRTLLVKGLEYDHVIVADIANHTEINDLYVALTRARKTVTILGKVDAITLEPSPRGPRGT